eukprot:1166782-Rhodomonas_salina.4
MHAGQAEQGSQGEETDMQSQTEAGSLVDASASMPLSRNTTVAPLANAAMTSAVHSLSCVLEESEGLGQTLKEGAEEDLPLASAVVASEVSRLPPVCKVLHGIAMLYIAHAARVSRDADRTGVGGWQDDLSNKQTSTHSSTRDLQDAFAVHGAEIHVRMLDLSAFIVPRRPRDPARVIVFRVALVTFSRLGSIFHPCKQCRY